MTAVRCSLCRLLPFLVPGPCFGGVDGVGCWGVTRAGRASKVLRQWEAPVRGGKDVSSVVLRGIRTERVPGRCRGLAGK